MSGIDRNYRSNDGKAELTTSYADDYRNQGKNWIHQDVISLAVGYSYFIFDPTALVAADKRLIALPISFYAPSGPVQYTIYEGTDYTAVTALTTYNPNRLTEYTMLSTIKTATAGTTKGTKLYSDKRGTEGGRFYSANEGSGGSSEPLIIDTSKKYLFEMNNTAEASIDISSYLSWFEL